MPSCRLAGVSRIRPVTEPMPPKICPAMWLLVLRLLPVRFPCHPTMWLSPVAARPLCTPPCSSIHYWGVANSRTTVNWPTCRMVCESIPLSMLILAKLTMPSRGSLPIKLAASRTNVQSVPPAICKRCAWISATVRVGRPAVPATALFLWTATLAKCSRMASTASPVSIFRMLCTGSLLMLVVFPTPFSAITTCGSWGESFDACCTLRGSAFALLHHKGNPRMDWLSAPGP